MKAQKQPPFNGAFKPLNSFLAHSKGREQPRKQYDALCSITEDLRKIGILATRSEGRAAHDALDELLRKQREGQVKLADMHLKDVGVPRDILQEMEEAQIHTVKDMASCTPAGLATQFSVLDGLAATLATLQWILEKDSGRDNVRF